MKRIKFRGDHTDTIKVGEIFGPDAGGLYHAATAVQLEGPWTVIETRQIAPEGKRVRYFGGRNNPPPPEHDTDVEEP